MADYLREVTQALKEAADALIAANAGIKRAADAMLADKTEHEDLRETVHRLESLVLQLGQELGLLRADLREGDE